MSARGGQGNGVVVRQSFFSGGMASIAVATGLLLDVVAAAVFGAGRDTDAFVAAARFPLALTAILMLLSTQVLVPTFTTWEATLERVRAKRLVTSTLLASVVLGSAVAGVLMLAATPMVAVMAPGFEDSQRTLAAELLRIMVWTIPLTAGCEVLRAWLNSRHMFVVPAAMTVILNVTAAAIVVVVRGDITILPIAYVAGSIAQFVLMFLYAVARGLRLGRPVRRDAEVTRLSRLTVRPSIAATLNPIVRAAELFVASFLPPGTATVLHYAHRLVHAIGGTVLFRQIMTAVLPRLTRAFVAKDKKAEVALGNLGLHLLVSVSFPLTALGVVLAVPAATTVFAIGRFSDHDARMLGLVIAVLSLSFIPSAVQRALLLPYYAVRDTKVPLRNSVYGALANVALLPVCVLPFINSDSAEEYALLGLGAAYVLSNVVNVVHAWWRLRHSNLPMPRISGRHVLRATAASVVGASWAWVVMAEMPHHLPGGAPIRLLIAGTAGMIPVLLLEGLPPLLRRRAARKVEKEARAEQEAKAAKTARENVERAQAVRPRPRGLVSQGGAPHPALVLLVVVVAATAGTLSTLAFIQGWGRVATVAPAGLLVGAGLFALAIARFEMFVLALLVVRTSLDALKFGAGGNALDPAALLGMLFLGAGVVWLLAQWREEGRVKLSPLSWSVVAFAGAGLLGTLVAPAYGPALVEWTRLASVCVMLLVVERAAARPVFRTQVVAAVMIAAAVPLVAAAYQIRSGAGLFDAGGFGRATGTFTHSNPMAAFMMLVVVMGFAHVVHATNPRVRFWCGVAMAAAAVGLFVTYTRAAWLAAILGILIVAGVKGRKYVWAAIAVVVIVVLTVPGMSSRFSDLGEESTSRGEPANSLSWRAEYWGEALGLARESPITGIGLKQVAAQSEEGKQPHNDFLRAYVEMGVVGLGAYGWMMWQLVATGRRAVRVTRAGPPRDKALAIGFLGCAGGYVLMCLVANLMSQVVVGMYFAAFAACAAAIVTARDGWRKPEPDEADETDMDQTDQTSDQTAEV